MKIRLFLVLGALLTGSFLSAITEAQVYSPRRLTQRVAPQLNRGQTNPGAKPGVAQAVVPTNPGASAGVARPLPTRPAVRIVQPPVDPEKVRASKEAALRKTVEFQKRRAEEGSQSAQYELGVRYLKGDGVVKDEATGRTWLGLSAQSGYTAAKRKLQELDRPAAIPKTIGKDAK